MPTYIYHCQRCNLRADYVLDMIHKPPKHCRQEMTKVFTIPNVAFKGSGFTRSTTEFEQIKKLDPDARLIKE